MATKRTPIRTSFLPTARNTEVLLDNDEPFEGFAEQEISSNTKARKNFTSLVRQREQVNQKLLRVQNSISSAQGQLNIAQLKTFMKNIDAAYSEFSGFHSRLMALITEEGVAAQEEIYTDFESRFNEISTRIEEMMMTLSAIPTAQGAVQQATHFPPQIIVQQQALRAPLPTFDGQYQNWPKFKTMFQDLMAASHDSDTVKLYHLERCLIGDAKNLIDAATIRDNNYAYAWRVLEDRYDNKRLIVDTHIQGIKNLPKMKKKSAKELRSLLDECTRHVEGLRFMEQS